jgi:hypothetical protein
VVVQAAIGFNWQIVALVPGLARTRGGCQLTGHGVRFNLPAPVPQALSPLIAANWTGHRVAVAAGLVCVCAAVPVHAGHHQAETGGWTITDWRLAVALATTSVFITTAWHWPWN